MTTDTSDTREITTPSGRKVVIRNYTTHGDDKQAQAILNKGISVSADTTGNEQFSVSVGAAVAADQKYVELLVQSIDGNSEDIPGQLEKLRSEDYLAVQEAVLEIAKPDPKAGSKS